MRELPSRGRCHAAFLLAYSIRLKPAATLEAWIAAARDRDHDHGRGDRHPRNCADPLGRPSLRG